MATTASLRTVSAIRDHATYDVPRNDPSTPLLRQHLSTQKPSLHPSPSVSSLADDERSLSSMSHSVMDSADSLEPAEDLPQYPGDDTRPTSTKELSGWYSYGWAAEVFVICGMGSFLPITLEQLARERGTLLSDRTKPCKGAGISHATPTPATNTSVPNHIMGAEAGNGQCIITILGTDINTASFAMYVFSISVLAQALLIISMSAAADHGKSRKSFLLSFAVTGSVATMLILGVVPEIYALGAVLAIVANTCFGASFVLLNSFLPILVRRHPSIQSAGEHTTDVHDTHRPGNEDEGEDSEANDQPAATDALLRSRSLGLPPSSPAKISTALQLSTQISSYGIGIGYLAAVIVQTLGIMLVVLIQPLSTSTTFPLRVVLFFVGAWWFIFSIPAALWLRPRPGPPLPFTEDGKQRRTWAGYIVYAWQSLGKTILRARRLKDVVLFLAAWFLLSDSIATISGTAVLFAKTELQMKPAALALISLVGTLTGVLGAFSWSKLSRWLNLRPSQTIIACICLFEVIPIYGLLGYIPAIKRLGVFGLQQPWEMYPLGAIYGFVLGGLSSYCRSLFGELIPPGSEAAFYALYAITDKGSSVFGPAIVGAITDRYGEIRPAFVFLAVLIFIPLPLMLLVDVDRGKREGGELARELEGKSRSDVPPAHENGMIHMIDEEEEEEEGDR